MILETMGIAFVVILIALICLGIGWLIKGKSILRPGACGRNPAVDKDQSSCGTKTTCSLCEKPDAKHKE